jgi:septum formation protein
VKLPPLILASASPRRAELLRQLQPEFQIVPSDAEEVFDAHLSPQELCQLNAHRKARAVATQNPDALVLGADTLVFLGLWSSAHLGESHSRSLRYSTGRDGEIMGKPRDLDDARRMLAQLQGRTHQVVTGVSLIHLRGHRERLFAVSTDVIFRPLTAAQIGSYLSRMNPLDKAGAYAIQEHGDMIVSEISGSRSNVVGLPVERVGAELAAWAK